MSSDNNLNRQRFHCMLPSQQRRGGWFVDRQTIENPRRTGFTLLEALIAVSMTLVIMLALAQGFRRLSDDISKGRARLNLAEQLRGISELMRNDLAGITVNTDPMSKVTKAGYFLYYDGPVTDHTAVTVPINNTLGFDVISERNLATSRFGDFDDILMFTARAKGDWFRGRVPVAIVKAAAAAGAYVPTPDDWSRTVTVASEYAEIAYFMMPVFDPLPAANANDPEQFVNANLTPRMVDADSAVSPQNRVQGPIDLLPNDGLGNAIPDRFILCRRVLLILPGLNVPNPANENIRHLYFDPNLANNRATRRQMLMQDLVLLQDPINFRIAMLNAYQLCDLSVRPARELDASGIVGAVAANSLEDLANPANRFAHIMLPGQLLNAVGTGPDDRSFPVLSLTGPIPLQQYAIAASAGENVATLDVVSPRADGTLPEMGFMRPEFMRRPIGSLADAPPTNEEVLSTNCVAFDIRGYDPSVRVLHHPGPDGQPGVADFDDDQNGTVDDFIEFGFIGSDDLALTPSDPAYYFSTTINSPLAIAATGAFVDLAWAWKVPVVASPGTPVMDHYATSYSGFQSGGGALEAALSLRKSGKLFVANNGRLITFQPTFDSFADVFERDGFRQQMVSPAQAVFIDGALWQRGLPPQPANALLADRAINGLDDLNNGRVDDFDERDSSPPFLSPMPAIQALIRLEDNTAGLIQQIAVTQELVTQ